MYPKDTRTQRAKPENKNVSAFFREERNHVLENVVADQTETPQLYTLFKT